MEQYIKKSALVAGIRNKVDSYKGDGIISIGVLKQHCEDFIYSLDDLEVKEVDLEKEIDDAFLKDKCNITDNVSLREFERIAKRFFELGLFSQLTWKDIRLISEIGEDFMNSEESDDLWKDEEIYYTAILNKLKEKGRDYKIERQITRELEQKGE